MTFFFFDGNYNLNYLIVSQGVSINPFTLDGMYPLIYAGDVPNITAGFNSSRSRYTYKFLIKIFLQRICVAFVYLNGHFLDGCFMNVYHQVLFSELFGQELSERENNIM